MKTLASGSIDLVQVVHHVIQAPRRATWHQRLVDKNMPATLERWHLVELFRGNPDPLLGSIEVGLGGRIQQFLGFGFSRDQLANMFGHGSHFLTDG